ncbi:metal ABC transporter ATP-binding protein [Corynebacterium anserum]|uniref:ATP-binding cassette domain-containing protein n=1 Tax=Corynebacterium anserum TaxID=2684406 RepID=A0A7G7YPF6_9CORY|nr:metal ABC transporter ATP-binding protein [Corynebacterium anserum]MBC2681998.1 ATP-binding cassette domain-containing protein [Corynebacterium anserum]QNH96376.1 ATP-binding cassette domain-containing protein [Corynebacterium anserum]
MTVALRAHNISVHYGSVSALENVDITLRYGQIHALIGTNGSGKSTLFKTLMGQVQPDSGQVELDNPAPGAVAYVPQSEAVDWNFPIRVKDVVACGRRAGRWGRWWGRLSTEDTAIVDEALARTDLTDYRNRQIGRLSGGQKKRTFVARGLAQQARILFLDEPFAGVDATNQRHMTELLRSISAEGAAILISTHDLDKLSELADEVTLLNRTVIAHGSVDEVLQPEKLLAAFGDGAAS